MRHSFLLTNLFIRENHTALSFPNAVYLHLGMRIDFHVQLHCLHTIWFLWLNIYVNNSKWRRDYLKISNVLRKSAEISYQERSNIGWCIFSLQISKWNEKQQRTWMMQVDCLTQCSAVFFIFDFPCSPIGLRASDES